MAFGKKRDRTKPKRSRQDWERWGIREGEGEKNEWFESKETGRGCSWVGGGLPGGAAFLEAGATAGAACGSMASRSRARVGGEGDLGRLVGA